MKHYTTAAVLLAALALPAAAQDTETKKPEGYQFKTLIDLPTTSVKDQYRSGTCWSFSTLSFLESEMMRMGRKEVDLSEMFVVNVCYKAKADLAVRMHGEVNFAGGGAAHDILWAYRNFGMMPEEVYSGKQYGEDGHVHAELDNVLSSFVDAVIENKGRRLTTAWKPAFDAVVDAYLGAVPEKFTVDGNEYTPRTYADKVVGINPDDYVSITSFTHHPFYTQFMLEVPDNWLFGTMYNLPLDEMMAVVDNALANGYTIAWGADVSEQGFSFAKGVAVMPETNEKEMNGSERSRWEKLDKSERRQYGLDAPVTEVAVTQELRQKAFDNYETTDDHGMHIVGTAEDQNGTKYYKVKNSWNTDNVYDGYLYASEAFLRYKTLDILVHKDALPKDIRKKLGIR